MPSPLPEAQAALDRQLIRECAEQYFHGVDTRDPELILDCFTPDCRYEFVTDAVSLAGAEVAATFRGVFAKDPPAGAKATTHVFANQQVTLQGDTAQASTMAIAFLLEDPSAPGEVQMRGLRYDDSLVRVEDGWRITHRRHSVLWQSAGPALPLSLNARAKVGQL